MRNEVFIYDCLRVPSGKKGGIYKEVLPETLSGFLIDILLKRNPYAEKSIDELLMANSIGTMGNMARYAALSSSLDVSVVSSTIDLQCAGSYQAIKQGEALVSSQRCKAVIAGGMESNSLMPTRIYNKNDPRFKDETPVKVANFSPQNNIDLKTAAENLALKYNLSKETMSEWTLRSHEKAKQFVENDLYLKYVVSDKHFAEQLLRKDLTIEKLMKLQTSQLIDRTNTADYHDGAGVVLLGSKGSFNSKPLAKIMDVQIIGIEPNLAPEGCVFATEEILNRNKLNISDVDLFEVNESFACKPLAFIKQFNVSAEQVNILGGNLAFGHPFAASGVLNLINLLCALKLSEKKYGLVSAGAAGGFGCAILIENIN